MYTTRVYEYYYIYLCLQRLCINYTVRHDYSSPAARALCQPRRAPRVLVSQPQRLYINLAVRRDYSSPAARALR
jgi:hypothetical protein